MIVALVITVVASLAAMCYCVRELRLKDEACDDRCRRLEVELLSVLGKTEAVSLVLSDERPPGQIKYASRTDDELRRERKREYAAQGE